MKQFHSAIRVKKLSTLLELEGKQLWDTLTDRMVTVRNFGADCVDGVYVIMAQLDDDTDTHGAFRNSGELVAGECLVRWRESDFPAESVRVLPLVV